MSDSQRSQQSIERLRKWVSRPTRNSAEEVAAQLRARLGQQRAPDHRAKWLAAAASVLLALVVLWILVRAAPGGDAAGEGRSAVARGATVREVSAPGSSAPKISAPEIVTTTIVSDSTLFIVPLSSGSTLFITQARGTRSVLGGSVDDRPPSAAPSSPAPTHSPSAQGGSHAIDPG